jgi:membrane carboxypeptidase/penicillin-binding protein
MEQSLNVPFARIGLTVGPDRVAEAARRLGITSPLTAVPSLALGSSEVTLLEMVRAYGVLAAAGRLAPTSAILGSAPYGQSLAPPAPAAPVQAIDPAVAYLVTSTLEGVVARGTGRALNQDGRFRALAGKTGTSNDWRDAWFVAYSPALAVGVWVGFDDGRSLRLTGAGAALPIVARFLSEAGDDPWDGFDVPDGITEGYVTLAGGGWFAECGGREVFLEGTEPQSRDCFPFHFPGERDERDWGRALKRGALRLLEELIGQQFEDRRSRR